MLSTSLRYLSTQFSAKNYQFNFKGLMPRKYQPESTYGQSIVIHLTRCQGDSINKSSNEC